MYVYEKTGPDTWTVGHYRLKKDRAGWRWQPESDHRTSEKAAARVRYLNGGERERGRKVRWTTGASGGKVEHVGWMVELVVVSDDDGAGLNSPCMVVERADGSVGLAWIAFDDVRFVD